MNVLGISTMSKGIHRDMPFCCDHPYQVIYVFTAINLNNPKKNGKILDGRESEVKKRNLDEMYKHRHKVSLKNNNLQS